MTKIAILADVHLGISNRQKDILWALNTIKKYCTKVNIQNIIILGDLFHNRQSLDIDVLCAAYNFFKDTKEHGQTWVAFPGNHDMFLKHSWDINSLKPLSEVLTIIDSVKILKINNCRFWILPFIYSESSYLKILQKIEQQYKTGDVLLTHIGVCAAKLNICFLLQQWNLIDLSLSKFHRIYAGHFHLKQQVGNNLWYPGSIIPFKFDEGDSPHGFYIYNTETNDHEFINIWDIGLEESPAPQYKNLHGDYLEEKKSEDIHNCNIRIAATKDYSPHEKQKIRERLVEMGARYVVFTDILREDDDVRLDPNEEGEAIKIEDLFEKWYDIDTRGTKELQRNLALKLNREIIQEGNEIYTQQN